MYYGVYPVDTDLSDFTAIEYQVEVILRLTRFNSKKCEQSLIRLRYHDLSFPKSELTSQPFVGEGPFKFIPCFPLFFNTMNVDTV